MSPKNKPLVSIGCLSYNQEKYIADSLESVRVQSHDDLQVIIVDDASTDNSKSIIESFIEKHSLDWHFIKHDTNRGICRGLNEIMELSRGDYFQLLALDDIIDPTKIEDQVTFLETEGERCAAAYSDARVINENGELLEESFLKRYNAPTPTPDGDIFEHLLAGNYIPIMSALFRTDAIRSVGGFDENLKFEDYDLWLRLAKSYWITFQNTTNVSYRVHGTNTHTTNSINWDSEYYKIYAKLPKNAVTLPHIDRHSFNYIRNVVRDYKAGSLSTERAALFREQRPTSSNLSRSDRFYAACINYRVPKVIGATVGTSLEGLFSLLKNEFAPS